jgi:hypothetical protein
MIGLMMMLAAGQSATFVGGNDLYAQCTGDSLGQLQCMSYVVGVADGIAASETVSKAAHADICIPNGASQRQLMDVVTKFLRDDPEHRALHASVLVYVAFEKAFPCPA